MDRNRGIETWWEGGHRWKCEHTVQPPDEELRIETASGSLLTPHASAVPLGHWESWGVNREKNDFHWETEEVENEEKSNRRKQGKQRGDEGMRRRDGVDAAAAVGYKTNLCTLFFSLINSCWFGSLAVSILHRLLFSLYESCNMVTDLVASLIQSYWMNNMYNFTTVDIWPW